MICFFFLLFQIEFKLMWFLFLLAMNAFLLFSCSFLVAFKLNFEKLGFVDCFSFYVLWFFFLIFSMLMILFNEFHLIYIYTRIVLLLDIHFEYGLVAIFFKLKFFFYFFFFFAKKRGKIYLVNWVDSAVEVCFENKEHVWLRFQ